MDFVKYITENALVLIPVLYILGLILKSTEKVEDKYIPVVLLPVGVILAMLLVGFTVQGFIQGVLITGATVYTNQLVKQFNKEV